MLFEAVTGKPPYTGQTPNELLTKHINAPIPSPVSYNDNVTPEYAAFVRRMMAKKVEDRPPSMWEILKEYRSIEVFIKKPKPPKVSVFDNMPMIKSTDDMIKRNKNNAIDESAKPAHENAKATEEKKTDDGSSAPPSTPTASK